jgi:predicted nuclease with RNAse H fold
MTSCGVAVGSVRGAAKTAVSFLRTALMVVDSYSARAIVTFIAVSTVTLSVIDAPVKALLLAGR